MATASLAGLVPMPLDPIYTLTKHAVVGYVRAMAPSLAERGHPHQRGLPRVRRHADRHARAAGVDRRPGHPADRAEQVAERRAPIAARSEDTGQAWVVQPGREPLRYEFRGVPGPR